MANNGVSSGVGSGLYPMSLLLDHGQEEVSILTWAFFRSSKSGLFLVLAGVNDLCQDCICHWYVRKTTGCHFTRHMGRGNWRGQAYIVVAGWVNFWCILPLIAALKIARYQSEH